MRIAVAVLLPALLALAACAREPAFRMQLPATIEADPTRIAIIGDLQQSSFLPRFFRRRENNADAQARLIADLGEHIDELGAMIIVGDLVFSARSQRDWKHFDTLIAPFAERMPVLPAIGNHDYPCFFIELCRTSVIAKGMLARFPWFAPGRPYAVERGDLLLLFLDSVTGLESQGQWLEQQLAAASGRFAAALVVFHHPAYSDSIDRGAVGSEAVQRHVVPRLRQADLPVVAFSGHIHGFEYIVRDGIHYLTTAGGGGPRGPIGDDRPYDRYRGPDCPQPKNNARFRPFNYLLLDAGPGQLSIEVRGFCRGDAAVRVLDRIEIPL